MHGKNCWMDKRGMFRSFVVSGICMCVCDAELVRVVLLLRGQLCALLPASRQIMRKWKFLRLISGSLETVAMAKIAVLLRKR